MIGPSHCISIIILHSEDKLTGIMMKSSTTLVDGENSTFVIKTLL